MERHNVALSIHPDRNEPNLSTHPIQAADVTRLQQERVITRQIHESIIPEWYAGLLRKERVEPSGLGRHSALRLTRPDDAAPNTAPRFKKLSLGG